jgi:hypothetical protein
MDKSNLLTKDWLELKEQQEAQNKALLEEYAKLKDVANRIFSTEDGKKYAVAMFKACHLLEAETKQLSNEQLQNLQAKKDFVNLFVTKLINKETFINIIKEM